MMWRTLHGNSQENILWDNLTSRNNLFKEIIKGLDFGGGMFTKGDQNISTNYYRLRGGMVFENAY